MPARVMVQKFHHIAGFEAGVLRAAPVMRRDGLRGSKGAAGFFFGVGFSAFWRVRQEPERETIRRAGTQVHGAFDGSILRDEGYHFARAGTFIERADSTARILDMKYFLLLPSLSYVGSSLDTGQWEQVLR